MEVSCTFLSLQNSVCGILANSRIFASFLAILDMQDLYGYALTKKVQQHVTVSESTMYPVLRRLEKGGELTTYSEPFEGRKGGKKLLKNLFIAPSVLYSITLILQAKIYIFLCLL